MPDRRPKNTVSAEKLLQDLLTDARTELGEWDDRVLDRILDRVHQAQSAYPSGHEHTRPLVRFDQAGKVVPYEEDEETAKLITYGDRTGEAVLITSPDDASETLYQLLRAASDLERAEATLRRIRQRWGILYTLECCQSHLVVGVKEPIAKGTYARYCRSCGDAAARNDGHMTPKAIMQALVARQSISAQLLAANPLPNGKLWKPPKARSKTKTRS